MKNEFKPKSISAKLCLTCLLVLVANIVFAQTITLVSTNQSPVSGAICPQISVQYSVNVPSGCTPNWVPTNGQLSSANGLPTVKVTWDDTPGATATLKCSFTGTNCSSSDATPWSALILSVNNQSFGSYNNTINIDYCTTRSVTVMVPHMYVPGTGGIA